MTNSVINATKSNMKKCTTSFINFPCLSSVPPPRSWSPEFSFSSCSRFLLYSQAFFLSLWSPGFVAKSLSYHINSCSGLSTGLLTFHLPPPRLLPDSSAFSVPLLWLRTYTTSTFLTALHLGFLARATVSMCPHKSCGSGASPRAFGSWGYLSTHEWLMWVHHYGLTHSPSAISTMKRSRTKPELDSTHCSSDSVTVSQYIAVCYKRSHL